MAKHLLVVFSNATEGEGDEATFNEWYTNTHLNDILKLPGFVRAQRFAASDLPVAAAMPYKYLAIYEIETDSAADAAAALGSGVGSMVFSPTFDRKRSASWFYTAIPGALREAPAAKDATA